VKLRCAANFLTGFKTNSFENIKLPGFEIIEPQKEYKGTYWTMNSVVKELIDNGETADMYFIVFSHKVIYKFLEPLKLEEIVGEKTASDILSKIVQDKNINNLKLGFIFEGCSQKHKYPPKQRIEFKGGGGIWQIGIPYQLYKELTNKYYSARPGEDLRKEYNSDITRICLGKSIRHPDPFGKYFFKNACIVNIYNVRQYNHQGKYIGNRVFGITTCPECPGAPTRVEKKDLPEYRYHSPQDPLYAKRSIECNASKSNFIDWLRANVTPINKSES